MMLDISWKGCTSEVPRRIAVGIVDPGPCAPGRLMPLYGHCALQVRSGSVRSVGVPCEGHHMDSFMTHTSTRLSPLLSRRLVPNVTDRLLKNVRNLEQPPGPQAMVA